MQTVLLFFAAVLLIVAGVAGGASATAEIGRARWGLLMPAIAVMVSGIATLLFAVHRVVG